MPQKVTGQRTKEKEVLSQVGRFPLKGQVTPVVSSWTKSFHCQNGEQDQNCTVIKNVMTLSHLGKGNLNKNARTSQKSKLKPQ